MRLLGKLAFSAAAMVSTSYAMDRAAVDSAKLRMETNQEDMRGMKEHFAVPMKELMDASGEMTEDKLRRGAQDIIKEMPDHLREIPMVKAVDTANWVASELFPGSGHAALENLTRYAETDRGLADFTSRSLTDVFLTQHGSEDGMLGESAHHRARSSFFPMSSMPAVWGPETVRGVFASVSVVAAHTFNFRPPTIGKSSVTGTT
jgi:hypothetical protein